MKKLYLIGGTMGVGKTAACQALKRLLPGSVFLDGDWCWDADPFVVNDETKAMVEDNICHLLNNFNADGIIVATATGSTAYNLSAGGPLVEPKAQLMLLTPVCAHTLNTRSVVLSAEDAIVIEMVKTTRNEAIKAEAVFDGGSSFPLQYGDRIEIRRSEEVTNLVKLSRRSFLSTLHKKLSS